MENSDFYSFIRQVMTEQEKNRLQRKIEEKELEEKQKEMLKPNSKVSNYSITMQEFDQLCEDIINDRNLENEGVKDRVNIMFKDAQNINVPEIDEDETVANHQIVEPLSEFDLPPGITLIEREIF